MLRVNGATRSIVSKYRITPITSALASESSELASR